MPHLRCTYKKILDACYNAAAYAVPFVVSALSKKVLISKCIYLIINAIEPFEQGGTIT